MRVTVTVILINKQSVTLPHGGMPIEGRDRDEIVGRALANIPAPDDEFAFAVVWREQRIGSGQFVVRLATGTVPKAA